MTPPLAVVGHAPRHDQLDGHPGGRIRRPGPKQPRTFGEAQLDLRFIQAGRLLSLRLDDGQVPVVGRLHSQFKDFIRPIPVNLTNCGSVMIRKETIPDEDPNSTLFDFTSNVVTDPARCRTNFDLTDDESRPSTMSSRAPTRHRGGPASRMGVRQLDCSASTGVTVAPVRPLISFTIDDPTDIVDCTYFNEIAARARCASTRTASTLPSGHGRPPACGRDVRRLARRQPGHRLGGQHLRGRPRSPVTTRSPRRSRPGTTTPC